MVASHSSQPLLSPKETLAVITARIKERRLYEARFLCRKLGQGLTAEQRVRVEDQLNRQLQQIEPLRTKAKAHFTQGDYERAHILYAQVEAVAIDVPGVAEEQLALQSAIALAERLAPPREEIAPTTLEHEGEEVTAMPAALSAAPATDRGEVEASPQAVASRKASPRSRFFVSRWLLGGAGLILLCVLVLLFVVQRPKTPSSELTLTPQVPSSKAVGLVEAAAEQRQAEEPQPEAPAIAPLSVATTQDAAPEDEEAAPPAEEPAPAQPALNLGGLQIE